MEVTKRKINQARLNNLIKVIMNSQKRIPEDLLYKDIYYNGSELLMKGTELIEKEANNIDDYGIFLSNMQLKAFIEYLKECKHNEEADNVVIGLYTHSNNKLENNNRGRCDFDVTDYAEVIIMTSEKTIIMHLNYLDTIKRKIGTYVKIHNTSWKRLPDLAGMNRKEVLIERIVITAALFYEKTQKVKITSKEDFLKIFNSVEAIEPGVIAKSIKEKGICNDTGNMKILDITSDKNTMSILKTIYNKLKNDSLKVNGSGAYNDVTYISFEYNNCSLSFEIGINSKRVELIV